MVTYQFEMDDDEWRAWKQTVPRTKTLDERLRELIRADTQGGNSTKNLAEVEGDTGDDDPDTADRAGGRKGVD